VSERERERERERDADLALELLCKKGHQRGVVLARVADERSLERTCARVGGEKSR
jgi:hypothetical protein